MSSRGLRWLLGLLAIVAVVVAVVLLTSPGQQVRHSSRPNIVFVLTDDLSMNLLRYMPHVQAMEARGMTFNDYFVSDSLCCPSRSSILTGNFPHDTHVFTNFGREGGFRTFYDRGEEHHTFAVALQRAGYLTALMGKYLNGYLANPGSSHADGQATDVPGTHVPPGWSEWDVAGWGYPEFNYTLNENGDLHFYGHHKSDYLTDVISREGTDFINKAATSGKPFFLELATFAPHSPYTPAPRDAHRFKGLLAPEPPNFDRLPTDSPLWLAGHQPLTFEQMVQIDKAFRKRAQAVQAVDRMIGVIEQTLQHQGVANNTYIVFSSDNGLHTGEYRLMPGKLTAFDTDIHVPLVVIGPRVPPGVKTSAVAENVDLAKTFTQIAGTTIPSDGHSLLALWHGHGTAGWRTAALIEHHGPHLLTADPDYQQPASGNPTTYEAMRTRTFLYVEYDDGEREFYDLRADPFELHNLAAALTPPQVRQLHRELLAMKHCHDGAACWRAMHVRPVQVGQ